MKSKKYKNKVIALIIVISFLGVLLSPKISSAATERKLLLATERELLFQIKTLLEQLLKFFQEIAQKESAKIQSQPPSQLPTPSQPPKPPLIQSFPPKPYPIQPPYAQPPYVQFPPKEPPRKPSITILSPNGGEIWEIGKTYKISWSYSYLPEDSKLYIDLVEPTDTMAGGWFVRSVYTIVQNYPATTTINWTIPQNIKPSNSYKIRVMTKGGEIGDVSDRTFSIRAVTTSTIATSTVATSTNWQSLIPTIRRILGYKSLTELFGSGGTRVFIETSHPLSIFKEGDLTGDGIPEALIYLGVGGAYTDYLTLMRLENGELVLSQFKKKDGSISPLMFLNGSSMMNGAETVMLPAKRVIYEGRWSLVVKDTPYGSLTNCTLEAYQWNPETKVFEYKETISGDLRASFCREKERYIYSSGG